MIFILSYSLLSLDNELAHKVSYQRCIRELYLCTVVDTAYLRRASGSLFHLQEVAYCLIFDDSTLHHAKITEGSHLKCDSSLSQYHFLISTTYLMCAHNTCNANCHLWT
ncbi:hypothetical protein O6H91_06G117200 [Diphasiastrum complanatum]|uniref:Uncharacterized protein n=1 Tax=Diphasiastrum complanatum TaxID=34168 RepID=A0ACC2DI88_DIPCM|nr:hypothetical protein O6H91_06G117200 [Diphasiastrum complanatum]